MSFPTQDEDRDFFVYSYSKPLGIDTFIWVKQRMRRLEVQAKLTDRAALFDEFYFDTPIK